MTFITTKASKHFPLFESEALTEIYALTLILSFQSILWNQRIHHSCGRLDRIVRKQKVFKLVVCAFVIQALNIFAFAGKMLLDTPKRCFVRVFGIESLAYIVCPISSFIISTHLWTYVLVHIRIEYRIDLRKNVWKDGLRETTELSSKDFLEGHLMNNEQSRTPFEYKQQKVQMTEKKCHQAPSPLIARHVALQFCLWDRHPEGWISTFSENLFQ